MNNSENTLTAQEREARAKYFREWRAKKREKVKIYSQRYWQKKPAQQNSCNTRIEGGEAE